MIDGVTTRLQRDVTQLQKDMEKLELRIDAKLDQMGKKFQEDLQVGLQQGLARVSTELGELIRQLLPQAEGTQSGKKISEILNVDSSGNPSKSAAGF